MSKLERKGMQQVRKEYADPSKPGSFQSPEKFYFEFKKRHPGTKLTQNQVQEYLSGEDTYTLNKEVRTKFSKGRIVVTGLNDIWEADLADLSKFSKHNLEKKYILGVIDIFSRKLYVSTLTNKRSDTVIKGFSTILKNARGTCNSLRTDMGSEFTNVQFNNFLKSRGIGHYYSHGTSQSAYIERVWKTVKKRLIKAMREKSTLSYTKMLSSIVSSYNRTMHSSIGMPPIKVNKQNEDQVRYTQYLIWKDRHPTRRTSFKYRVGDVVRISKRKEKIQSEYKERWSRESYVIFDRMMSDGVQRYKLKDMDGEKVAGSFYQGEIQKIRPDREGRLYEIDKVLRYRTTKGKRQALVSWRGYNKKFNSWIEAAELKDAIRV